jgi:hypothetical protein
MLWRDSRFSGAAIDGKANARATTTMEEKVFILNSLSKAV